MSCPFARWGSGREKGIDPHRQALAGFLCHTPWHTGPYQGGSEKLSVRNSRHTRQAERVEIGVGQRLLDDHMVTLDRLLTRIHANKAELLVVLDRPEVPLNTNGSENDIRACVTRRKISGGTRSEAGKQARDTFLGLIKTCQKLGLSTWDYLGHRLKVPGANHVPPLPELVRQRCLSTA